MSIAKPDDLYEAYLTAEATDSERVPITGERIVIVLGQDEAGRPLELSIDLKKRPHHPSKIAIYSINEPIHMPVPRSVPVPIIESSGCVNVFQISIKHEPFPSRPGI